MLYLIVRQIAIILLKVLCRLQVFGRENIPLTGGFILAANHTSYLDPPIAACACPRVVCFMAKEELFRNAAFARFITALNAFPIKKEFGSLQSLRRAIKELRQGKALVVFPEGRRTVDGQLDEPLPGIGLLAATTSSPIVPAFIEGSNKALPVHSKFIRPEKIRVYFGKPLWPQQLKQQLEGRRFYQAIAEMTMQQIADLKARILNCDQKSIKLRSGWLNVW